MWLKKDLTFPKALDFLISAQGWGAFSKNGGKWGIAVGQATGRFSHNHDD